MMSLCQSVMLVEVFKKVSQLAQSCADGYYTRISVYRQTGSDKLFAMEGSMTEETAGMIPHAIE